MSDNINITPDMINNLVDMLKNKNENSSSVSNDNSSKSDDVSRGVFTNYTSNSNSSFNNFDIKTMMKIKSIMDSLNKKDDPKANLLYSLKPYLRKSRQAKLDQYINIIKISEVANLFSKNEEDTK